MEYPRYKHELVLCRNKVYAIGGYTLNRAVSASVEAYDANLDKWETKQAMNFPRADFTAHSASENMPFIYVFGGTFDAFNVGMIERYDCDNN